MAVDVKDTATGQLVPLPNRRGRKPSGNALSSADRQKAYRERQADRISQLESELELLRSKLRLHRID